MLLKPWLAGLDPLPPLAPDAALTTASVLQPPDLHRLEEARHALARAAPLLEGGGDDDQGGSGDDERARATRALLAQARRCAATLSRGGGEGGMAGQVAKLMALQALVARLSPLPNAAAVGGGAVGVGVGGGGAGSSSAEAAMALRFAGAGAAGRELRRVLVPPLLELCRGGGGERGGDGVAMAVKLEAAKALGALGAVPPWELMLWDPYDPTAGAEEAAGGGGGGGGGAGHGGTQGRTRGRSRGQEAQQQAAAGTLPPVQVCCGNGGLSSGHGQVR